MLDFISSCCKILFDQSCCQMLLLDLAIEQRDILKDQEPKVNERKKDLHIRQHSLVLQLPVSN